MNTLNIIFNSLLGMWAITSFDQLGSKMIIRVDELKKKKNQQNKSHVIK